MFTFTVKPDGGEPFEIEASTRDVLLWEKAGPQRSMSGLVNDMHIKDVYWIAHHAARRQGMFDGNLKEFEDTCDLDIKKLLTDENEDESEGSGDEDPTR